MKKARPTFQELVRRAGDPPTSAMASAEARPSKKVAFSSLALTNVAALLALVAERLGSVSTAALWFRVPNPLLGNLTPIDLIALGRFKKLRQIVTEALGDGA